MSKNIKLLVLTQDIS